MMKNKSYYRVLIITSIVIMLTSFLYGFAKKSLPIYSVYKEDKVVALTFDCAWAADDMDDILEILKKHEVKASFFMVGDWMRKYPDVVKKIYREGHDLGNHSDTHPHVTQLSKERIKKDIRLAHQTIKELTGAECWLYRAPYGEYNQTVVEAAKECGYEIIQWDVDSLDWKNYGKQPLIDKVLKHKNLSNGSIVLLHNGTQYTKQALEEIIVGLKTKGFKMLPLSKMLIRENYHLDHAGKQYPNH